MDPGLVRSAEIGETISGSAYAEALLFARSALANKMAAFHQRYDLLLTPTLAVKPSKQAETPPQTAVLAKIGPPGRRSPTRSTSRSSLRPPCLAASPAAGLPAGLQIVGPYRRGRTRAEGSAGV